MASLNKRHQARNEQALQELVRSVPGNDRCADCQAANPGWASWSLGIFLCVRCGSLHRKLGTHISKVKSLSMDSWTVDQVDVMRKTGNVKSNQKYNPRNVKPPIPLDADEVDSAMERFIRQKYEQKNYIHGAPAPAAARTAPARSSPITRSVEYDDESPPPPPPKTPPPKSAKLFGFLSRKKDKRGNIERQASASESASAPPGKVVSAAFGVRDEGMEWKLITLREMGFPDDTRNSSVLKGVNGDLERAIESLVRLGEGTGAVRRTAASSQEPSRRTTPAPAKKEDASSFGALVEASNSTSRQPDPSQSNFWESMAPASAPAQPPPQSLENQFANMQLHQPQLMQSNPLFPNATGGHPPYLDQSQAQIHNMTQSVPQLPPNGGYNPYAQQGTHNPFMNAGMHSAPNTANLFLQGQATGSNPFLQQQQQQFNMVAQYSGQQQYGGQQPSNPYEQQQQQPQLREQILYQQPLQQQAFQQTQTWPMQGGAQQFAQAQPSAAPYQQGMPTYMPQQNTGRIDKSSILALYNYPQLAPQSPQATPGGQASPSVQGENHAAHATSPTHTQSPAGESSSTLTSSQRSVTMPVSGTKNPFKAMSPTSPAAQGNGPDQSGRHSPDAFASLSARFVR